MVVDDEGPTASSANVKEDASASKTKVAFLNLVPLAVWEFLKSHKITKHDKVCQEHAFHVYTSCLLQKKGPEPCHKV